MGMERPQQCVVRVTMPPTLGARHLLCLLTVYGLWEQEVQPSAPVAGGLRCQEPGTHPFTEEGKASERQLRATVCTALLFSVSVPYKGPGGAHSPGLASRALRFDWYWSRSGIGMAQVKHK